jgi:hypothetical protein
MPDDGPPKPPDLQKLVTRFGGYDKITPEAWAEWDRVNAEWREERRAYYERLRQKR